MDIKKIEELSKKPKLFKRSKEKFWDDEHISKKMLDAHLNPNGDAASRKHSTIDASVKWLSEEVLIKKNRKILDLGCGPGLYASRLSKLGHRITGIDYSIRSINYAKKQAENEGLKIDYLYENYLTIDYQQTFDAVLLIYCDFGALTNKERDILLKKIHKSLKPGGLFIFDVFTSKDRKPYDNKTWAVNQGGFWSSQTYLELSQQFDYPTEDVHLDQKIIVDSENKIHLHRIYNHFYSKQTITEVLEAFEFQNHRYYSDISGKNYSCKSETLAVITQK